MKRILFLILLYIIYYLLVCFIYGGFNLIEMETGGKFFFVVFGLVITGGYFGMIADSDFLLPVEHEEKVSSVKQYIGELQEELRLYADAKELEKRINELRKK